MACPSVESSLTLATVGRSLSAPMPINGRICPISTGTPCSRKACVHASACAALLLMSVPSTSSSTVSNSKPTSRLDLVREECTLQCSAPLMPHWLLKMLTALHGTGERHGHAAQRTMRAGDMREECRASLARPHDAESAASGARHAGVSYAS